MRKTFPLAVAFLSLSSLVAAAIIPAGTEISVRLTTKIASDTNQKGDPVEAVVIAPVLDAASSSVVLAPGNRLRGKITEIKPAAKLSDQASVLLAFSELVSPSGQSLAINSKVIGVENARETVNTAGAILGIVASETAAARVDQGLTKLGTKNARLAELLSLAKGAVLTDEASGAIAYEPGVELLVQLTSSADWKTPVEYQLPQSAGDPESLFGLVNAQPSQTVAANPPKPSDLTNLMFIGSEEAILDAFRTAGWTQAHAVNAASVMETVRAMASMRGYKEAPMSSLLLEGKTSNFDLQKGNNTFAKRHHLRIWRRPQTFQGKPVWVCSSTHDIGIAFSEENRTFIHVIDSNIDKERSKIVTDLLFTGKVSGLSLVDRPGVPRTTRNATGDTITTDSRMAVLVLQ